MHLSNVRTEIIEVTSADETAVCNLGSINLARHTKAEDSGAVSFDFDKLARTVWRFGNSIRLSTLHYYPLPSAYFKSSLTTGPTRPDGIQEVFFQMRSISCIGWLHSSPPAIQPLRTI